MSWTGWLDYGKLKSLFDTVGKLGNIIQAENIEEQLVGNFTNKLKDYSDNNMQANLEEEFEATEPYIEHASHIW